MDSNNKINDFKLFVKSNPFLIGYIRRGEKSWQDFYEVYDLYGEDEDAWVSFLESDDNMANDSGSDKRGNSYLDDFIRACKNIDVNKMQEGISSLQKTLGLFGDLFNSKENVGRGKEYNPRPLYRRFED